MYDKEDQPLPIQVEGLPWNDPYANPLADINTWVKIYKDDYGRQHNQPPWEAT